VGGGNGGAGGGGTSTTTTNNGNGAGTIYHPTSEWKEPPRFGPNPELTLYDIYREPRRPPPRYRNDVVRRPVESLSGSELQCVICLDYIRNTRIVMECLHRFCEECIERYLRVSSGSGRNECPSKLLYTALH